MLYKKIELKIPLFFGCLGALVFCTLLASLFPGLPAGRDRTSEHEFALITDGSLVPDNAGNNHFFAHSAPANSDLIIELYRRPEDQARVIAFFRELCPTPGIAEIILANADEFTISPSLAFALSWEESRFNPRAVNRANRNGSIDRGLFQLNNLSFPSLELAAFFDPQTNAYYGMSHLRHCLDTANTEVTALAMYNAGASRVRNNGTPLTTLNYISRILENRQKIENRFLEQEAVYQAHIAALAEMVEPKPFPRFALIKPLGIRLH